MANPHKFPDFYPEYNPLDIYRAHLANTLSEVTGVAAGNIYPCLQWTQSLAKGDIVLPVPALRVKSGKPADLAQTWAKEVSITRCFHKLLQRSYSYDQAVTNEGAVLPSFPTLLWLRTQ